MDVKLLYTLCRGVLTEAWFRPMDSTGYSFLSPSTTAVYVLSQ